MDPGGGESSCQGQPLQQAALTAINLDVTVSMDLILCQNCFLKATL